MPPAARPRWSSPWLAAAWTATQIPPIPAGDARRRFLLPRYVRFPHPADDRARGGMRVPQWAGAISAQCSADACAGGRRFALPGCAP
jgi:hypothetical protein